MRLSISIKLNDEKLGEYTPNHIYEYAELIEILREHGFVHKTCMDIGFIKENANEGDAEKAIKDAVERLHWLGEAIVECECVELGEKVSFSADDLGEI
ncbi:MAG: hypothetical protein K2N18_01510 [Clostridia bacterium]|nr:hypothetical protein [Clostridia bacterium]